MKQHTRTTWQIESSFFFFPARHTRLIPYQIARSIWSDNMVIISDGEERKKSYLLFSLFLSSSLIIGVNARFLFYP